MATVILVSPHPVDGYPPVQNQACLLADTGWAVELITTPLASGPRGMRFSHPGVTVHEIEAGPGGKLGALQRAYRFVSTLSTLRRNAHGPVVEVAFEPSGQFYSDMAWARPAVRIAHFHECLQSFEESFLEKRLVKAIAGYQLVVVPDEGRGELIREQLKLSSLPTIVPNYPLLGAHEALLERGEREGFEVIYCGSISTRQMLGVVVKSVSQWPESARLTIIGSTQKPAAQEIIDIARQEGVSERVDFLGWVPYDKVKQRLAEADLGISLLDGRFDQWRTALGASNKRYQYMQAGLPQIADMNPGVPELIEGQGIGRCLTNFCEIELASLVSEYASDAERCQREGARAFGLFKARYNYAEPFCSVIRFMEERIKPVNGS
ncbi:glycosyltransferase [Aurantiacibacter rhizosphaerae]|uniref:Glycosyltransferase n=1 Tax=Aurantiacibacter rhizosphaerae TaxID=2691582 RepID=A0A844XB91_9SPHN|nr:glycosyltransferase [Aurantiacibacter rhizosphaerae]MWV26982.1 glycosyltransferase [Aurantiacibacter rhizosphaerae]